MTVHPHQIYSTFFPKMVCLILLTVFSIPAEAQHIAYDCHQGKQQALAKIPPVREDARSAQNSRSDTIDILHYHITLDITNPGSQQISGNCLINCRSKMDNITEISLDLLRLTVDSVEVDDQPVTFQYNDTLLKVDLGGTFAKDEELTVRVYYHGSPQTDGSGWGGFYFSATAAFNLDVGFAADPHNYGRVWFPCFDNFVERSTYEFTITTDPDKKAFCNGLLQDTSHNANNTIDWHWYMHQTIPTYLASVAVGQYQTLEMTHPGIQGPVLIQLGAIAGDTAEMRSSFIHLTDCIDAFEASYGAHSFDRVGFNLVAFTAGAMEHATNIAYPANAVVNGSLADENLMAHEFGHHWWGDLVTCETAEDMWINEGWASYSEKIFFEHVYGKERYKDEVRANHDYVLQYAHVDDEGFRAISGVPHAYTYGTHVYDKGADVAHTMRGYMGDDTFFECITSFLQAFAFTHASSQDFRDHLSECSGMDMTAFFDNWVFAPGVAQFSIDSIQSVEAGGQYEVDVYIRQKLREAPEFYDHVPLEITFFNPDWQKVTESVTVSGECGVYSTTLNTPPVLAILDLEEKISDGISDEYRTISTTGNVNFGTARMAVNVTQISDSAFLHISHNWAPADPFQNPIPNLHVSQERYWKVQGMLPADFKADATIKYNGTTSGNGGHLDIALLSNVEDSLVLLYRPSPAADWSIYDSAQFLIGLPNDKSGDIGIPTLFTGEYTLGIYDADKPNTNAYQLPTGCTTDFPATGIEGITAEDLWRIYPNPVSGQLTLEFRKPVNDGSVHLYNLLGQRQFRLQTGPVTTRYQIATGQFPPGVYYMTLHRKSGLVATQKIMIIH